MLALVTGGSASGKSEYAEALALRLAGGGPRVYLATMRASGAEGRARAERHRALRAGKGFVTLERPADLGGADIPPGAVVLLECVTNLAANELFGPGRAGPGGARAAVLGGVAALCARARHVVAVSGEVFADGAEYDPGTREYLRLLGGLNRELCARAGFAAEVVCGIPVIHKDEEGLA